MKKMSPGILKDIVIISSSNLDDLQYWRNDINDFIFKATFMPSMSRNKTRESIALSAFFKIGEEWGLNTAQQMRLLGMTSESTFYSYKNAPQAAKIDQDKLERLSLVLGIYKNLRTLLSDEAAARSWMKEPNKAEPFQGRTALDYLLEQGHIRNLYC